MSEWVQDKYTENLPGGEDPLNTSGSNPVVRGGNWGASSRYGGMRSVFRVELELDDLEQRIAFGVMIDFRLVRNL